MYRPDVIRQPLGAIAATFAASMALITVRVLRAPFPLEKATATGMPLGEFIDGLFHFQAASCAAGLVIALLSAVILTGIIVRYSVSTVRTYLPMILYTMTAYGLCFPVGSVSTALLPLLLIVSSGNMIASFRRSYQFENVFRSAFYLGIVPMLYAPGILLVPILPITLILYRRTVREAMVALSGFILPFVFCSVIWWGSGHEWNFILSTLSQEASSAVQQAPAVGLFSSPKIWSKIYIILYTALLLCSVAIIFLRAASLRTRPRKIYVHFIWLLALCIGLTVLNTGNAISFGLIAVPGSVIITAFFLRYRGWFPLAVYAALIGSVLYINLQALVI